MSSYPQLPKTERHRSFWAGGAGGHGTEPAVQTWGLPSSPKHLYIYLAGWARSRWGRTHRNCVYLIGWRAGTQDSCWGRAEILWDLTHRLTLEHGNRERVPSRGNGSLAEQVDLGTEHVSCLEPWV